MAHAVVGNKLTFHCAVDKEIELKVLMREVPSA